MLYYSNLPEECKKRGGKVGCRAIEKKTDRHYEIVGHEGAFALFRDEGTAEKPTKVHIATFIDTFKFQEVHKAVIKPLKDFADPLKHSEFKVDEAKHKMRQVILAAYRSQLQVPAGLSTQFLKGSKSVVTHTKFNKGDLVLIPLSFRLVLQRLLQLGLCRSR